MERAQRRFDAFRCRGLAKKDLLEGQTRSMSKCLLVGSEIGLEFACGWLKKVGDYVGQDEPVVELETDKVTLELPAPVAGGRQLHGDRLGDGVSAGAGVG